MFETLMLSLLSRLLPWAIERVWQQYKFGCAICCDPLWQYDPLYTKGKSPRLCPDCSKGVARLTRKDLSRKNWRDDA